MAKAFLSFINIKRYELCKIKKTDLNVPLLLTEKQIEANIWKHILSSYLSHCFKYILQ